MRIRMLVPAAGPHFSAGEGQIVDLPAAEARAIVEARHAELVDDEPAMDAPARPQPAAEKATARPAPETTARPVARKGRA
jgi:hypothetical protein